MNRSKIMLWLAVLTAFAMVIAACGGGAAPAAEEAAAPQEAAAEEAAPAEAAMEDTHEAPMLHEMVVAGDLPPLEERIPAEPLVIEPYGEIGQATEAHANLRIEWGKEVLMDESLSELKSLWKNGLAPYY